jgi:WD40 repeat protein
MKPYWYGSIFLLLSLLLAACSPVSPTTEATPSGPIPASPEPGPRPESEEPGAFSLDDLAALQPGDVLVQKDYEPTFFRIESMVPYGRVPSFTLYADSTLVYLREGLTFEDEQLLSVQLSPEESVELLNQVLDLGLPGLESHTDFCENPGGEEGMCVMDASFTILRGRLPSKELHEVVIYADFANDPAAFQAIGALLESYEHPEAVDYRPPAASLFISPLVGQVEGPSYEWLLGADLPARASQERPWATYLEGEALAEFMEPLPRNMGDFIFEYNGRPFNVFLVPWLPYTDYRAAIQAEFPAPSPGETAPGLFSACPLPGPGEQGPGGQLRLVYAQEGELLLWDEGREPLVLGFPGEIEHLRLSPDGRTAVYVTQPGGGAQVWAVDLGDGATPGEPRPLTGEGQLSGRLALSEFSPDGELLAFTHEAGEGDGELWAASLDGSGARRLVSAGDLRAQFPFETEPQGVSPSVAAWIPGTDRLVYSGLPNYAEGIYIYIPEQLYQVDAGDGAQSPFLPAGSGGGLVFSPDGRQVAITRLDSLSIYDLQAGGQPVPVEVSYQAVGFGEYYFYPPVEWAPDSSRLLLAQPEDRDFTSSGPVGLWDIPADGSSPSRIAVFTGFAPSFDISPDLSRLAYWDAPAGSNERSLRLANVDGSEEVLYTSGDLVDFLAWAPDSQRFVYTQGQAEGTRTLLGNICAAPVELAGFPAYPSWLGGGRFLLAGDRAGALQVFEANDAGELTLLLVPESHDRYAFAVLP